MKGKLVTGEPVRCKEPGTHPAAACRSLFTVRLPVSTGTPPSPPSPTPILSCFYYCCSTAATRASQLEFSGFSK
ncbi:hypothetical protein SK128_028173 [Halocaridina rubra]|uniref:Uncharacterized protein n=1 Tax=Halocaridina rubra TaxID=373956 RepID=A0AAN8X8K9_HALRR